MGRRAIDRVGMRYGRLVVVARAESLREARWHCVCDCGNTVIARATFLACGWTKSCGCLRRENARMQGERFRGQVRERKGEATQPEWRALAEALRMGK